MQISLVDPHLQVDFDPGARNVENTNLETLVQHREFVLADAKLGDVYRAFQAHERDYCAVLERGSLIGVCSRTHVGFLMAHRYGFSLYSQQPVREHMVEAPLSIKLGSPVREVLEQALGRGGKRFNDDVVLLGQEDEYLGMIPVPALVRLQSALVAEKFQAQEILHRRVSALSRQAGMAEVATGVLHNVGNVLNSVNVSASVVCDLVRKSKLSTLEKVTELIGERRATLGDYLQNDARGKLIPDLLLQLTIHLRGEQKEAVQELELLVKHIHHIANIVAMQQSYAKVSGIIEPVQPNELVDDAAKINAEAFERHNVSLIREFEPVPRVAVDRHKTLQILTNLFQNAKQALGQLHEQERRLIVSIKHAGADRIKIAVRDNGVGIAPENLHKIFGHGFTTKRDGHGFGLHSAALAAREMGGSLHAHSEGLGLGAEFTLELPAEKTRRTDG